MFARIIVALTIIFTIAFSAAAQEKTFVQMADDFSAEMAEMRKGLEKYKDQICPKQDKGLSCLFDFSSAINLTKEADMGFRRYLIAKIESSFGLNGTSEDEAERLLRAHKRTLEELRTSFVNLRKYYN